MNDAVRPKIDLCLVARLERHTDEALKRQRNAWRDALHRQAVLDEKDVENFREER